MINNDNVSIYMAHISSLGLLMACSHHIIPGHWTCSFLNRLHSPELQHCNHVALVTCHTTIAISVHPGTLLHLSDVK